MPCEIASEPPPDCALLPAPGLASVPAVSRRSNAQRLGDATRLAPRRVVRDTDVAPRSVGAYRADEPGLSHERSTRNVSVHAFGPVLRHLAEPGLPAADVAAQTLYLPANHFGF